jgi:hypothetical protein
MNRRILVFEQPLKTGVDSEGLAVLATLVTQTSSDMEIVLDISKRKLNEYK